MVLLDTLDTLDEYPVTPFHCGQNPTPTHSLLRTATGAFRTETRLHANGAPSGVLSPEVSLVKRGGLSGGVEV